MVSNDLPDIEDHLAGGAALARFAVDDAADGLRSFEVDHHLVCPRLSHRVGGV